MKEEEKIAKVAELRSLTAQGLMEEVSTLLAGIHEADVADFLEGLTDDERAQVFGLLPTAHASETLMELEEPERSRLLNLLSVDQLAPIIEELDSDEATDIVAQLPPLDAQEVLSRLDLEASGEVRALLTYPEESAGGIMQLEMVSARQTESSGEILARIRGMEQPPENVAKVFVVDHRNTYLGYLTLFELIRTAPESPVTGAMHNDVPSVPVEMDREEVARHFQRYDLVSAPVIDPDGRLIGRITIDDIVEVIEDEVSEDLLRMGGTHENELLYTDRPFRIAGIRLPWLMVNLAGGLITGYLLWLFKVTLESALALITFVPVITAMGGNAGIQSSTIMVRMLALGRLDYRSTLWMVLREVRVGLFMGPACGLVVGIAASLWHGNPALGLLVATAMTVCIVVATLMGILVPVIFSRASIDPALASGPFVTTANDITGIVIYLSIATFFLKFVSL